MKKKENTLIVNVSEIDELVQRVDSKQLHDGDLELIAQLLKLIQVLLRTIDDKQISIARLKRLIFGNKSEKRKSIQRKQDSSGNGEGPANAPSVQSESAQESNAASTDQPESTSSQDTESKNKRPGHGRLSVEKFTTATVVICPNENLKAGDKCPNDCCSGHLYDTKEPQILIKREAKPIIEAVRYERQVLRCSRCEQRFTASLPENVSEKKYDVTADVMIALVHYGAAMPFYRLERLQAMLGVPLPSSTQFERSEIVANAIHPVVLELERIAAQSDLFHTDDTSVRILALMKENESLSDIDRRGMHTTGIAARSDEFDIILYCSGRRYSGENLTELLKKRKDDLTEPILMADAENKNWAGNFKGLLAKCLAHGRRQFVDCEAAFPKDCGHVLDELGKDYYIDSQTKNMTGAERLAYHKQHSEPIMDKLKSWIKDKLDNHEVESNSSLGKAFLYISIVKFCS
jgi:transposase